MPALICYKSFYGFFNLHADIKKHVVTVFLSWGSGNLGRIEELVCSVTKLWQFSGMNHVIIIRHLIMTHYEFLKQIPQLIVEVDKFIEDYKKFVSTQGKVQAFIKVLEGDKCTEMKSSSYPNLFRVAREIALIENPTFGNYASNAHPR
jgi:hypothetical protein